MAKQKTIPIYDLAEECRALSAWIQGRRLALPCIISDDDPDASPDADLRDILKLSGELAALGAEVMNRAGLCYTEKEVIL
jgi:hypothetical protein